VPMSGHVKTFIDKETYREKVRSLGTPLQDGHSTAAVRQTWRAGRPLDIMCVNNMLHLSLRKGHDADLRIYREGYQQKYGPKGHAGMDRSCFHENDFVPE